MPDGARSDHPGVQAQLDRLAELSPGGDRLGLERILELTEVLGRPQDRLPPVFHVAGTNGKGSTCAFLRAMLEAGGYRVHVFTSPHLVRFNERIRLSGTLIDDAALESLLGEVLDHSGPIGPSFFEATAAAAFLAFARTPADALLLEVGMGGRLDATNIVERPLVTGIAALGFDHQQWLGKTLAEIAGEKAGIVRRGVPLVTLAQEPEAAQRITAIAAEHGAPLFRQGQEWDVAATPIGMTYRDNHGTLDLSRPALVGAHQIANAGLAIAIVRSQTALPLTPEALARGLADVDWPARLQRLQPGPLIGERIVWLDGGHNPQAAIALAEAMRPIAPFTLVLGALATKDPREMILPFAGLASAIHTVDVEGHASFEPSALADLAHAVGIPATPFETLASAIAAAPADRPLLIAGSLYLAGEVLRRNGQLPR